MTEDKTTLLFSPGPTPISTETLNKLAQAPIHHRTKEFEAVLGETFALLKFFFQTQNHVFLLNASGTGAMEALLVNCINPGENVLAFDAGKFGERWSQMAQTFGAQVDVIKHPWGKNFDFEIFEEKLKKKKYSAFLIHACETSTATKYPIDKISDLLKKYQPDCLLLVDGITAVGCMALPMDELEIDGLIAGSQKSLGLMTGLSFVSLSDRAWSKALKCKTPRFYFDLVQEKKFNLKNETHFSSPVNLINALHFKLLEVKKIGLDQLQNHSLQLQKSTKKFLESLGCCYFSESPSESLSAFYLPTNVKVGLFQNELLKNGLYLAGGQDHLKDKILRWGHMGDISMTMQDSAYEIFKTTLKQHK